MEKLRDLYIEQLQDAYSAENQILDALPKMIEAAEHTELRSVLEEHLVTTEGQVQRLESIFTDLQKSPKGKKCKGMEGLIKEGNEALQEGQGDVLDAAVIGAAQKVEHYEIALYGTLRTYARELGRNSDVQLLEQTLEEEKEADRILTEVATGRVNEAART